jgi:hypothetical protein
MATPLALSTVVVAMTDQVSTPMNNETVLLHLRTGKYYSLNRAGTFLWEKLKQPITVGQIVEAMLIKFDIDRPRCEVDVQNILASLIDAGFIQAQS